MAFVNLQSSRNKQAQFVLHGEVGFLTRVDQRVVQWKIIKSIGSPWVYAVYLLLKRFVAHGGVLMSVRD